MRSAQDEADDLTKSLAFTVGVIADSTPDDLQRIAEAYAEARILAGSLPLEAGSARPRIVACLQRFQAYKEAQRIEAAGWMLSALRERIEEKNLPGWEQLQIVADKAAQLLQPQQSVH